MHTLNTVKAELTLLQFRTKLTFETTIERLLCFSAEPLRDTCAAKHKRRSERKFWRENNAWMNDIWDEPRAVAVRLAKRNVVTGFRFKKEESSSVFLYFARLQDIFGQIRETF